MTVKLSQPDFNCLVGIVQNLPEFSDSSSRRELIKKAFENVSHLSTIASRLDLEGSPMGVAVEVISFLCKYGKISQEAESLAVFLEYISSITKEDDRRFILDLFQRYSF